MGATPSSSAGTSVVSTATPTVVACLCRSSGHHHYRRPHCKPASSSSGILKKVGVTKKTKKRQGPLIWKALRSFCMRRRVVSFQDNVRAIAFARTLGCSTVPGDGTLVTVGLGAPLQETHEPLAGVRKPGDRPIEERAWLPSTERVRLLRASMGDAKFFGAWRRHRQRTFRIRAMRKESVQSGQDCMMMPSSWEEARARALQLSQEAGSPMRKRGPTKPTAVKKVMLKRSPASKHLRVKRKGLRRPKQKSCRATSNSQMQLTYPRLPPC